MAKTTEAKETQRPNERKMRTCAGVSARRSDLKSEATQATSRPRFLDCWLMSLRSI